MNHIHPVVSLTARHPSRNRTPHSAAACKLPLLLMPKKCQNLFQPFSCSHTVEGCMCVCVCVCVRFFLNFIFCLCEKQISFKSQHLLQVLIFLMEFIQTCLYTKRGHCIRLKLHGFALVCSCMTKTKRTAFPPLLNHLGLLEHFQHSGLLLVLSTLEIFFYFN